MTAQPPAVERLVDAYLHDLERALAHLEVDERRDVVDSVGEHIDVALEERDGTSTAGDVEDVLRQLGPVERIAHNADTGSPTRYDHAPNEHGSKDHRRTPWQYLLAALIIGMAITASFLIMRVPPLFSPGGGDPIVVAQLTWIFIVFTVAAGIVRRNTV